MRATRIALLISVALNLIVAGILLGAWLDSGPSGRDASLRGAGPMAPYAAAMEPGTRKAVLEGLRGGTHRQRPSREDVWARFEAMLDAIRANPFDRGQLEDAFAKQRAAGIARQQMGENVLIDTIAKMTAEERAAYADRLQQVVRRPNRR